MSCACRVLCLVAVLLAGATNDAGAAVTAGQQAQSAPDSASLLQQARDARKASPADAPRLAEAAADAARAAGRPDQEADALRVLGESESSAGRIDKALQAFRQALERERAVGNPRRTAEALVNVSRMLVNLNHYEEAIQSYLEAARLAESAGDVEYAAVVTDLLGVVHFVLRNYERAMALCRQAEPVLQRSANPALRARNLEHIGIIYTGTEQWADALDSFNRVLRIHEGLGNTSALMGALGNVALALNGLKRPKDALVHLDRALAMAPDAEDRSVEPMLRLRRARVYQALGRMAEAERDFAVALAADRTLGNKRRLASTLTAVAGFYRAVPGRERRAVEALEEALALNQSVYNDDTTARVQELQERFDSERRQRRIEALEHDKIIAEVEAGRQRQLNVGVAVLALLLVAGLSFAIVRYRTEARTTRELREALQNVQTLQGLLPICAHCKKIRNDKGYWQQVETYIGQHSGARFSHGICPDCMQQHYRDGSHRV